MRQIISALIRPCYHGLLYSILLISLTACLFPGYRSAYKAISLELDTQIPNLDTQQDGLVEFKYIAEDASTWWQFFEQPVLNKLIEISLQNSRDIATAVARLEEALSRHHQAKADRIPTLALEAKIRSRDPNLRDNHFTSDKRVNNKSVGLTLNWQLDVFGRLRSASKAASSALKYSDALVRDTQRIVISQLCSNFFRLRTIQRQLQITRDSVARRKNNADRVLELKQFGYATSLDTLRSNSQLYQSKANLMSLELQEVQLINNLAVLAGINLIDIRELLKHYQPLPSLPEQIPLPSVEQLIRNRPDLRAAEYNLLSAAYSVNAAKANLYPDLSIDVNVTKAGLTETGGTPSLSLLTGEVLSNLTAPIFFRGRLLANIDAASAQLKQQQLAYESAMATALANIDTSLVAIDKNRHIFLQLQLSADAAAQADELTRELFLAGELDYTRVIDEEQRRLSAEISAIAAQRDVLVAYVTYISAIAPVW